ncbi:hypothetical protein Tco_1049505 [Tanacetum coccineum]
MMVWCKVMAAAAANDEGVSNGDGDETKVMKDMMGMTMVVDLWCDSSGGCSAKDKSPSHPSPPTPMVGEMHKEAQQAASGLTSLGATSEEGAHPQLSCADSIAEADPRMSAPNDSIPSQQHMDKGTKNYSIDHIFTGTKPSVLVDQTKSTGDGLKTAYTDSDESEEEKEFAEDKDTHASSHDVPEDTSIPHPPSLKSAQIQELMAQVQLLQS